MLALVGFVGLCLLVGVVGGSIAAHALPHWYRLLRAPPGTLPSRAFIPVWLVLYVAIGTAGWLVWKLLGAAPPLRLWGWQLAANALWPSVFFGLRSPGLGMGIMLLQLLLIGLTILAFRRANRTAALLMVPYFAWSVYAAYLNAGFLALNGV